MSTAIYFGKVNLISQEINEVLEKRNSLSLILENTLAALKDGSKYIYERILKVDDGIQTEEIEYSLSVKNKDEESIHGFLYKKSFIHYKEFNKYTGTLEPRKIANTEGIEFYYDAFKERIGYQRSQRFGYKEVLEAFQGILNSACEAAKLNYKYTVTQYNKGIDLSDIKKEINESGGIQTLNVKYQIPNPDSDILEALQNDSEKTIAEFENANLSSKSVIYQSYAKKGLNIDSEMINNELNNIETMHSHIDAKRAMQCGYVVVETTSVDGVKRSSTDSHPLIKTIEHDYEFKDAAKNTILALSAHNISVEC